MKAVWIEEIGSFVYGDIAVRTPASDEALVKVTVTGLCRTDLKIIRVGHRDLTLPRVPGEEVIGTVEALGSKTSEINIGQRVYIYPGISCGRCKTCESGAGNLCADMRIMGFHRDGGFAEYVVAPIQSLTPVPSEILDEEAILTEPLSCCLNAIELAAVKEGEKVGIWGAGPAGTLLSRAVKALGAKSVVIEKDPRRRLIAEGSEKLHDKDLDAAFVAVGDKNAYMEAMGGLGPRGRLVVFSGLAKDDSSLSVDFNHLHYLEQTIIGAYGCSYRHGVQALKMIGTRQLDVKDMISHKMPLAELDAALGLVERREGMKILLYP
ncbi:MAG: alcohol dehydrogenase catalytic domain-containing protein [Nitrospirae bacterium]|nr:alcohol dehydrogenase catalytic domain-containing protein [Nitrospirota bacterium]